MLRFCQGSSPLFDLILAVETDPNGILLAKQVYPVEPPLIEYEKTALRFCFPLGDTKLVTDKFTFATKKGDSDYSYGYVIHYPKNNTVIAYCVLSQHFDQLRILQMMELIVPKFEQNNAKSAISIAASFQKPNIHGDTLLSEQLVINSMVLDLLSIFPGEIVGNLIAYIAADSKIIIQATSLTRLSKVCFSLISLIYPLNWPGVFIPLLPAKLTDAILAPFPFIIGIPTALASNVSWEDVESHIFLDVDTGTCEFRGVPELPKQVRSNIKSFAKSINSNPNECSHKCRKLFLHTVATGLGAKSTEYQEMQNAYNSIQQNNLEEEFSQLISSSQTVLKLIHSPEDQNVEIFNTFFPESDKPSEISLKLSTKRNPTQILLLPPVTIEGKSDKKKPSLPNIETPDYLKSYGIPVMPAAINRAGTISGPQRVPTNKPPIPQGPKSDKIQMEEEDRRRIKKDRKKHQEEIPYAPNFTDLNSVQLKKVKKREDNPALAKSPSPYEFQSVQLKKLAKPAQSNKIYYEQKEITQPITPPIEFQENEDKTIYIKTPERNLSQISKSNTSLLDTPRKSDDPIVATPSKIPHSTGVSQFGPSTAIPPTPISGSSKGTSFASGKTSPHNSQYGPASTSGAGIRPSTFKPANFNATPFTNAAIPQYSPTNSSFAFNAGNLPSASLFPNNTSFNFVSPNGPSTASTVQRQIAANNPGYSYAYQNPANQPTSGYNPYYNQFQYGPPVGGYQQMRLPQPIGQQQPPQYQPYFGQATALQTTPVNQGPSPAFPAASIPSQFQPGFPQGGMPSNFNPPGFSPQPTPTQKNQQNQMQRSNSPSQSMFGPSPSTFNPGVPQNPQANQQNPKPSLPGSQPSTFQAPNFPNSVPYPSNANFRVPPQTGEVFRQLMGNTNSNGASQFNSGSASRFPSPGRNQGTIQNGPDFRQLMNGGPVYQNTSSGSGRFPSPVNTPGYMQPNALPPAYSHSNSNTNSSNGGQQPYVQHVSSTTNLRLQAPNPNLGEQPLKPVGSIKRDSSPSYASAYNSGYTRNARRKTADWLPAEVQELRNMAQTTRPDPQDMSFKQKLAKFQALVGNN